MMLYMVIANPTLKYMIDMYSRHIVELGRQQDTDRQ